jgi:hypothetical protein
MEKKPEDWEIVRDKLLGVEIYGDYVTPEMIIIYLMDHFNKTSEIKEIVYINRNAYLKLVDDFNVHYRNKFGFLSVKYYWQMGTVEILPL